jgi:PAS domain S-box-containing protein
MSDSIRLLFEQVLHAAGEGIYGLDLEGCTTFINPAAARMIDWSVEDLIGKPQHGILHHTKADGAPYPREQCPIYAAFTDGAVRHVEDEVFWRKDGTSFPVEYISTPMRDGGRIVGAVVTFRDVSDRRAATAALANKVKELEEAQHELFRTVEQLVATEDMVLAGQTAATIAVQAQALLRNVTATDASGAGELRRASDLLGSLAHLGARPAAVRLSRVDVAAEMRATAGARATVEGDGPVMAEVSRDDFGAMVTLLLSLTTGRLAATVAEESGAALVRAVGDAVDGGGSRDLAMLSLRRLVGKNMGSLEVSSDSRRSTFALRLPRSRG